MTQPVQARPLARARYAVFALFASFGVVLSTWAVHLPVLQHNVGLSNAMLGTVLLILGAGSLVGMQLSGALVDRVDGGRVATIAGAVLAAAITLPLAASTLGEAIAGAFVLGAAVGCADVGMNAVAVSVERDYGRPIMASFHAMFSIGTVVGSLLGAAGFALRLGTLAMTTTIAIICLAIVGSAFWALRSRRERTSSGDHDGVSTHRPDN